MQIKQGALVRGPPLCFALWPWPVPWLALSAQDPFLFGGFLRAWSVERGGRQPSTPAAALRMADTKDGSKLSRAATPVQTGHCGKKVKIGLQEARVERPAPPRPPAERGRGALQTCHMA